MEGDLGGDRPLGLPNTEDDLLLLLLLLYTSKSRFVSEYRLRNCSIPLLPASFATADSLIVCKDS